MIEPFRIKSVEPIRTTTRGERKRSRMFPGQALLAERYLGGAIRAVEIGSVMVGSINLQTGEATTAPMELVRSAIPRRVYPQSGIGYGCEVVGEVFAPPLRHFTARIERAS